MASLTKKRSLAATTKFGRTAPSAFAELSDFDAVIDGTPSDDWSPS